MWHHIFMIHNFTFWFSRPYHWRSGKTETQILYQFHDLMPFGLQLYDRVQQGWMVLCLLSAGLLTVCLFLTFCYFGTDPLLSRLQRRIRRCNQSGEGTRINSGWRGIPRVGLWLSIQVQGQTPNESARVLCIGARFSSWLCHTLSFFWWNRYFR